MRKTTMCLLLMLCACAAFGQNMPQWKVIQYVALTHQTQPIPQTTLFTPTTNGFYRVTAYLSASGPKQTGNTAWFFNLQCTDIVPFNGCGTGMIVEVNGALNANVFYAFSPHPGAPVSYSTGESNPPPVDTEYNLVFTIEQLQ